MKEDQRLYFEKKQITKKIIVGESLSKALEVETVLGTHPTQNYEESDPTGLFTTCRPFFSLIQ